MSSSGVAASPIDPPGDALEGGQVSWADLLTPPVVEADSWLRPLEAHRVSALPVPIGGADLEHPSVEVQADPVADGSELAFRVSGTDLRNEPALRCTQARST
jgi:hypothetical protein